MKLEFQPENFPNNVGSFVVPEDEFAILESGPHITIRFDPDCLYDGAVFITPKTARLLRDYLTKLCAVVEK